MIIAQAPMRISIFGGGTDVGEYAEKYGGYCVNMAINLRQRFEIDDVGWRFQIDESGNEKFYETFFKEFEHYPSYFVQTNDAPLESGLGSSASAAVALVGGLSKDKLTREEVAQKAWDIEVNKLGLFGGKQDQYASAFGGMGSYSFEQHGTFITSYPKEIAEKFADNLLLIYTGRNRKSPSIQEGFRKITKKQKKMLDRIKEIAYVSDTAIRNGEIKVVANLFNEAWKFKKQSNNVTNKRIDRIYQEALREGALAGKVCGAGRGGFMAFIVEPIYKKRVIDTLEHFGCSNYNFSVDFNGLEVRRK